MKLFILVVTLLVLISPVGAEGLPVNWPWHSVSIGFPEGTPQDIKRYKKELGINAVRLQIKSRKYSRMTKISGPEALKKGLEWADQMLDTCAELGVTATINISHFPSDASKPKQRTKAFWDSSEARLGVLDTVSTTVKYFKGRGKELGAYDFMSEPVLKRKGKSIRPPLWPDMLEKIAKIVKTSDPKRWLVVSPGPWGGAGGYSSYLPQFEQRIIWGAHMYFPHRFTHQGIGSKRNKPEEYPGWVNSKYWDKEALEKFFRNLRNLEQEHGTPVMIGEFSTVRWAKGGEQYIKDLVLIFDKYDWGWSYFSGSGWQGWNPDYNQNYWTKGSDWKKDYVGSKSVRWDTLRDIFGVKQRELVP
jgi:endoglucanase